MSKRSGNVKRKSQQKKSTKGPVQAQPSSSGGLSPARIAVAFCFIVFGAFLMYRSSSDEPSVEPVAEATASSEQVSTSTTEQGSSTRRLPLTMEEPLELPDIPGVEKNRFNEMVGSVARLEDPVLDGWATESFNEVASKQLKRVGQLIGDASQIGSVDLKDLVAESFSSKGIRPADLTAAFADGSLAVKRGETNASEALTGVDGFREAVQWVAKPLAGTSDQRFKFKIVRVGKQDEYMETKADFQMSGRTGEAGYSDQFHLDVQVDGHRPSASAAT